ncbi:MAG: hypothetical protein K5981_06505 [Clostridia bacterium]|nr:hypothetical protein [Clostridia bacterium]
MKSRVIALLLVAALCLTALLNGCTSKPATTEPATTEPATTEPATTEPAATEPEPENEGPVYGGVLKVTINTDATSLDAMMTSSADNQVPATHIFETALFPDAGGQIWPGVCDYTFDGEVLTLTVRDGVTFHNGDPVTIDDVYASSQRWLANVKAAQKQIGDKSDGFTVDGDSIVVHFNQPAPLALQTLAQYDQGLYIMPKAICEKYPDSDINVESDLIGTGPYKFVEHKADQYVRVARYDGYVPTANEGATGFAKPKMAYCDEIYFYSVNDKTTRITGVQTGAYDIGVGVPSNMLAEMGSDPNLRLEFSDLGIMACAIFNNEKGPCTDKNLRNAILACLDMDEMMLAAQGDASLYRLNPSYMMTSSAWFTDESLGKYNNRNLDKAKEYLAASSYKGETLRFVTTNAYDYFYNTALRVAQFAGEIGITIDVQSYDNATLKEYRSNPDMFDIFSGGLTAKADPTQIAFMDDSWAGFWKNEKKTELLDTMSSTTDFDTRYAAWVDLQKLIYEEVPNITFGERINPIVCRANVHDIFETTNKYYWNTWKDAE